jgi:hypothetical protein
MPEPSTLPRWATDGGTTTEPSSGKKDTGWVQGERAPAKWFNWLFNVIYLWLVWLRGEPNGEIVWSEYFYASNTSEITVGPIAALRINGKQLSKLTTTAVSTVGHTADSWNYIYAYDNAGTLDITTSTTVPDASLTFMNGDPLYRYLGCYLIGASTGVVRKMRMHRGRYLYRDALSSTTQALAAGTAATPTLVALAPGGAGTPLLPPHARFAELYLFADTQSARIALVSGGIHVAVQPDESLTATIETAASTQQIYYDVTAGGSLDIYVMGFTE